MVKTTMGTVGSKCSNCDCATSGIRRINIECSAAKQGIFNVKASTCSAPGRAVGSAGPSTSAGRPACIGQYTCETCPSTSAGRLICSSSGRSGCPSTSGRFTCTDRTVCWKACMPKQENKGSRDKLRIICKGGGVVNTSSSSESSSDEDVEVIAERLRKCGDKIKDL